MENKRILTGFLVLLTFFTGFAGAQESEVFAPFVSQLEGELRNNLIRLSWKDSPDIRGPVFVYRSELPFQALSVLPVPTEIPYGRCSYLDEADQPGVLYYFVVASDEWGRKYAISIPFTNMVDISVGPENVPGYVEYAEASSGQASSLNQAFSTGTGIGGINTKIEENRVIISFSGADRVKNLILYRSLNPIRRQEDLLSALIIRQKISSPVIDYPLPGITYYYALVYEEEISAGLFSVRPGSNITGAVQIVSAVSGSRELPLPQLNLSFFPPENITPGPEASAFSPERRTTKAARTEPDIFSEDFETGEVRGEDYQFKTIVQGYFSLKQWENAEEELRRFLDLPRTKHNQAKARFYLGQAYYFQERHRDALFEFLQAQDEFPQESNIWIQAVLSELVK